MLLRFNDKNHLGDFETNYDVVRHFGLDAWERDLEEFTLKPKRDLDPYDEKVLIAISNVYGFKIEL